MATEKPNPSEGAPKSTTSSSSSSGFPCPNPEKPLSLEPFLRRMQEDPDFAQFIRGLLCDTYGDDTETAKKAQACLDSYYQITKDDLEALCIPPTKMGALKSCTTPGSNLLISVPVEIVVRYKPGE